MVIDNNKMLQQNAELPMYQAVKMANANVGNNKLMLLMILSAMLVI